MAGLARRHGGEVECRAIAEAGLMIFAPGMRVLSGWGRGSRARPVDVEARRDLKGIEKSVWHIGIIPSMFHLDGQSRLLGAARTGGIDGAHFRGVARWPGRAVLKGTEVDAARRRAS